MVFILQDSTDIPLSPSLKSSFILCIPVMPLVDLHYGSYHTLYAMASAWVRDHTPPAWQVTLVRHFPAGLG